ncbi:MAG: trypsin-like serine protease [Proteobacteria bacterium]|nr:trypsin-like serine protease [Pseudomonadota bacterium]
MKSSKLLCLSLLYSFQVFGLDFQSRLINGKPVEPGTFEEVIQIRTLDSICSATVVGPRVIITAAHCGPNGAISEFKIKGVTYHAKINRSGLYPGKDHDISVGIVDKEIVGIQPASIGGIAKEGLGITLLGYGCTDVGGHGGSDGILRYGETVVTGFSNYDMVSRKPNGAALCFGDSGGPAFVFERGQHFLIGINSKGNIQDTNYNTRTDISESRAFMKNLAVSEQVEICGFNKNCGAIGPVPPTCQLVASPDLMILGQSFIASLKVMGEVTDAQIDNQKVIINVGKTEKKMTPVAVGNFILQAKVSGPGGTGTCSAPYTVKEKPITPVDPPKCQVTLNPSVIQLGQSLGAKLTTEGEVTTAELNGQAMVKTGGEIQITPPMGGSYTVKGKVVGPGGTGECAANYLVEGPTPNVPNYSVVPTFCGDNTISETDVRKVCLGLVKFSQSLRNISVKEIILITYRDGTQDVMPLLIKSAKITGRENRTIEQWALYANGSTFKSDNLLLDTRVASVTFGTLNGINNIPLAISGRAVKNGQAFNVESLKKLGN